MSRQTHFEVSRFLRVLFCAARWVAAAVVILIVGIARGANAQPPDGVTLEPPAQRVILGEIQPVGRQAGPPLGALADEGDGYLLEKGERVQLLRATEEVAVKYAPGIAAGAGLQALQQAAATPALRSAAQIRLSGTGAVELLRSPGARPNVAALAASPATAYAYPVLVDPPSRCRMIPTDQVIVRVRDGVQLADIAGEIRAAGLEEVQGDRIRLAKTYLLRLSDPKRGDPMSASARLAASPNVVWAEPNFIREVRLGLTPDDTLFGQEQHLHNTGQNGATTDADIDAPEAWDTETGDSSIVIAILDDGIDTSHTDLRIFNNPGETGGGKETNGVDDDGNGYIDDFEGWDFAGVNNTGGDNNPDPTGTNGHGMGCAGVAAAIGNNTYRTAGVAYGCSILPVKIISDGGSFSSNVVIGNAIEYAADYADILSNSWGGGSSSPLINSAIDYAVTNGRGGLGCPVFFATGNYASVWMYGGGRYWYSVGAALGAGTYSFGFRYSKDGSISSGEDLLKIDNLVLIGGDGYTHMNSPLGTNGRQDFEGAFPPSGWALSSSNGSNWTRTSSGAFTGTGGTYSAVSGPISHSQWTELRTPNVTLAGDEFLVFPRYLSSEAGFDGLRLRVYDSGGGYIGEYGLASGVITPSTPITYPASYSNAIAVGASTDVDYRSDYSCYGTGIDFVASSNGGWNDIVTLDPTGTDGWTNTDYKKNFGGTSSACPTGAGVAALILSRNPNLPLADVLFIMRYTCDHIGGVTYTGGLAGLNGWNQYYGYGRLNANAAVNLTAPPPTAVELAGFSASKSAAGVLLEWKTGFEVNNLGFHVYREVGRERHRVTPELIAGSALLAGSGTPLTAGRTYAWLDAESPVEGAKYWLQDVDLGGQKRWHGPVVAGASDEALSEAGQAALMSQLGERQAKRDGELARILDLRTKLSQSPDRLERGARSPAVPMKGRSEASETVRPGRSEIETQQALASGFAVKIRVNTAGWYRVTQPELIAAGLDPRVDPRRLQMFAEGEEIAIVVPGEKDRRFDPGDAVEFYGKGLDTPWTDAQTYWLVEGQGRGRRIASFSARGGAQAATSFLSTAERKDRTLYFAALQNGEADNFFGPPVTAEPLDRLIVLHGLVADASADAILEITLQGMTKASHDVSILVNDAVVGSVQFEGQDQGSVALPVAQSLLNEGDNLITLATQGGETDVCLADTMRLNYWRAYTARNDRLDCTAEGSSRFAIGGFAGPDIRIIDVTDPKAVSELRVDVKPEGGEYVATSMTPAGGVISLLAFCGDAVLAPLSVTANEPSRSAAANGVGMAIVSHGDFLGPAQSLAALRQSEGLSVAVIDVEDLYDECNFGNPSPWAIRAFLDEAVDLRFVLLFGDASLDPRNYLGLGGENLVPTKTVAAGYLETASDDWFADSDGDGVPSLAIGRLSVQTVAEAEAAVRKIIEYEGAPAGDWPSRALLVADNNDSFDFEAATAQVGALFPAGVAVDSVLMGQVGPPTARNELLAQLNAGQLLVNFMGHGSVEAWTTEGLFGAADASALTNGSRMPLCISMNCLNGFFHDVYTECLAEALMRAEHGGAVAVLASSGLTGPEGQAELNQALVRLLLGEDAMTIGEATAAAKSKVGDLNVRRTWNLLGDPSMRLK